MVKAKIQVLTVNAQCGSCGSDLYDKHGSINLSTIDKHTYWRIVCLECKADNILPKSAYFSSR